MQTDHAALESADSTAPDDSADGSGSVEIPTTPEAFLSRWAYDNPALADRRAWLRRWLIDETERSDVARELGIPLGQLLRAFNETAPLGSPAAFRYRGRPFAVTGMPGICDDIAGARYPMFGAPRTLRCYLTDPDVLPQRMYEAADWNFMDASRPGFVGYGYGVQHGRALYLAGLQSDLAVRYAYLFQARGDSTEVRDGDQVSYRPTADLASALGAHVPALRRSFQRSWIQVLLGATLAWARDDAGVSEIALLQFSLSDDERGRGNVVHRVYRQLPTRLGGREREVRLAGGTRHVYSVASLEAVERYLGSAWSSEAAHAAPLP